ncbi:hypothetical protein AVEN_162993-1 [Araneus ventricosus]|uniref:Uncharacterized protein n=1 Tax=Araneus ventricosus TaxID=182803 RepID=A0A4Y2BZG3_ARAVE|nr:hypothetical protein AVEN_162993-1 [Araneus ventricosus]
MNEIWHAVFAPKLEISSKFWTKSVCLSVRVHMNIITKKRNKLDKCSLEYTSIVRIVVRHEVDFVTNMESRFPAKLVLWLGREFYKVKHGVTGSCCSGIPDLGNELGDHFGDLTRNLTTNRRFQKMQPFSRHFYEEREYA